MENTLLIAGIALLAASIVGSGLKAFQVEVPAMSNPRRQLALGLFGLALLGYALYLTRPLTVDPIPKSFDFLDWEGRAAHVTVSDDGFLLSHEAAKQTPPRLVETLKYKTWDGGKYEAVLRRESFLHAPEGNLSGSHRADVLNYLSPSGAQLSVKLTPSGTKKAGT